MSTMQERYTGMSTKDFDILAKRYQQFLEELSDVSKEPIRVFKPLTKKSVDELVLIREVSVDLQNKKDDDVKKAAQNKEAEEEKVKEAKESAAQETSDEAKPETGKEN